MGRYCNTNEMTTKAHLAENLLGCVVRVQSQFSRGAATSCCGRVRRSPRLQETVVAGKKGGAVRSADIGLGGWLIRKKRGVGSSGGDQEKHDREKRVIWCHTQAYGPACRM